MRRQPCQMQSNGNFEAVLKVISIVTLRHNVPLAAKARSSEEKKEINSVPSVSPW